MKPWFCRPVLFLLRRALHDGLPDGVDIQKFIGRSRPAIWTVRRGPFSNRTSLAGCAHGSARRKRLRAGLRPREAEGKPVQIGLLQRHATDHAMRHGRQYFDRAAATGKSIAVVGAGPAGLACRIGWR